MRKTKEKKGNKNMNMINASNFRKDLFKYLEQTVRYNEPINIITKSGNVVLINEEEYRGILETLYIDSIPGLKAEILAGTKEEGVEIDWRRRLKNETRLHKKSGKGSNPN